MSKLNFIHQPAVTFAFNYAEYVFCQLRDFYLKLSLGGFPFYESDLEKLLKGAMSAMPEGSPEREAFFDALDIQYCLPDDYEKSPESATALNTLSNKIFGKDLLPGAKDITVEYLVYELMHNDSYYFNAYEKWLCRQLAQKKRAEKLSVYINTLAKNLHHILSDNTHSAYQDLMELLEKMSDKIPGVVYSQPTDTTPIEDKLHDQGILYTLLHHAFEIHLRDTSILATRSPELVRILKLLEKHQPSNN